MNSALEPTHRYIVIEGPIGVGKTSLARRLAQTFESELLLEGPEDNPFLERFYQDPVNAALPTQLYFLTQRVQQMRELRQGELFSPVRVSDFLMEKDYLFAQLTLNDDELKLYEQIYEHMVQEVPRPDLVIYLQAPIDVLQRRISGRGRQYERTIENGYLEKLSDAYTEFFYNYRASPLLIVNAANIDLVNNDEDYNLLLQRIAEIKHGRHFFNPSPLGL